MKLNAGRGERRRGTAVAWKEVFLHCDTYQSINCRGTDCVDQVDRNVHEQDSEDERQHDGGGGAWPGGPVVRACASSGGLRGVRATTGNYMDVTIRRYFICVSPAKRHRSCRVAQGQKVVGMDQSDVRAIWLEIGPGLAAVVPPPLFDSSTVRLFPGLISMRL